MKPSTEDRPAFMSSSHKKKKTSHSSCTSDSNEKVTSYGDLVWGKVGNHPWWPGMSVKGPDCGKYRTKPKHIWILWFGECLMSEVILATHTLAFKDNFQEKYAKCSREKFGLAVREALEEMISRTEISLDIDPLKWALNNFPLTPQTLSIELGLGPNITAKTKQKMEDIKKIISRTDGSNDSLNNSDENDDDYDPESSILKRVRDGEFDIKDICVSCDKLDAKVIMQHPVMEGGLCEECKNHLTETLFTLGEDGLYTNCVLCALAGNLIICDNSECFRSFCTECVEILVSKEALKKVLGENPWHCYFCVPYVKEKFGLIQIKNNWKLNVLSLYEPQRRPGLDYFGFVKDKKPITVLSLFDGIGTGRLILDKLGFDVAEYYAFETDENAINISKIKLPNKIIYMGDIREFENKQIKQIGPIDLVIAGSPCNDLSLVNPNGKGLFSMEGSGYFFFYFFKVLKAVEIENSQTRHPFFWLFENVSHMKTYTKEEIGRFLECDPVLVNAVHFSPQHRARYFWGNIPGLYSRIPSHILESNITLDSALTPNLNRVATVRKIRTVTTKSNSLRQGVQGNLPVKMNGKSDNIWITELEKVFGFEKHYTDTGNLNVAQRQQLLGRAWSVQVVQYLLTPLKNYYKLKTSVSIQNV